MIARRALRAALLIGALATSQLSCTINDYCVGCDPGDAGGSGAQDADPDGDAATGDATDAGCIPSGAELCDGLDNDCNGSVDDGALPEVGDLCANQSGVCAGGTKVCQSGAIACDKAASPEVCDNLDNNCNGLVDEGDPGGGATCGTEQGECVAGTLRCQATTGCDPSPSCTSGCCYTCDGFVDTRSSPEACNGRDDDCDGNFDENVGSLGPCTWAGATDEGQCAIGTLACQAGFAVCTGAVYPAFELCNQLDDDCDAAVDEIYDTSIDPLNCGACGNACPAPSKTCIGSPNAGASCMTAGDCTGGSCVTNAQVRCTTGTCSYQCGVGFYDDDGMAANGCEYRCLATGAEECDGADNDCDGAVDEGLTPPALCRGGGECGATAPAAQCGGAQGWTCTYPGTVQFPETLCDGKDNDCDLNVDENQPNLGAACDDGGVGACRGTGSVQCDSANLDGPAVCTITSPGLPAPAAQETCDNVDNDCDGTVDEGSTTGALLGQEWIDLGGGVQIMKYEASRLDASGAQQGSKSDASIASIAASPTGATQNAATGVATFSTMTAHALSVGTKVRVSGVGVTGYNGLWTVASVPTATTFTAKLATTGLSASGGGAVARLVGACSRAGVIPWTNVTYPEALAVCESMGASLCSETRWHQACSAVTPRTQPVAIDGGTTATSGTRIEAEDFYVNAYAGGPETACGGTTDDDGDGRANDGCPAVSTPESGANCTNNTDDDGDGAANDGCPAYGPHAWIEDYTPSPNASSGIANMRVMPNPGAAVTNLTTALTQSPHLDYRISIPTAASDWRVWVRMFSPASTDNTLHVGVSTSATAVAPTLTLTTPNDTGWNWVSSSALTLAAGEQYVRLFMAEDGLKVDAIFIARTTTPQPPSTLSSSGGRWSYASTPTTYQATVCNGADQDAADDDIQATGSLASCYADHDGAGAAVKHVFDQSGNVKEWTLARVPGQNPIRGGSSSDIANGISCDLNFALGSDSFFFPNVGFRCCR